MSRSTRPLTCALALAVSAVVSTAASAQRTSENEPRLKAFFEKNPQADADKDGVLTLEEAKAYFQSTRKRPGKQPVTKIYQPTGAELEKIIAAGTEDPRGGPLGFDKGNGLRVLSTGHSWVAPAMHTFPVIARAAGFEDHRHRHHLSGGATGAANSIWLKEFGQFPGGGGPQPVLLPAIATGKWDVMTWGMYYEDKPEYYTQWMDVCLAHNPDTIFYIQDAWPRADAASGDEADLSLDDFLARQEGLNRIVAANVDALNEKYPGKVRVIPVGDAMMEMLRLYYAGDLPGIEGLSKHLCGKPHTLWTDGGHLSPEMKWWEGYVYYAALYQRSPEPIEARFPVTDYNAQLDRRMRQAAWRAVIHHPLSGVNDKNANGVGDERE